MEKVVYTTFILLAIVGFSNAGILYPLESESRSIQSLDGIWNFRLANKLDPEEGYREKWHRKQLRETGPVTPMPVPSSYNDITNDKSIKNHAGVVWYDRNFYIPLDWNNTGLKVWLRFGSVYYAADVYINGELVISHAGGHIPFQADVSLVLKYGERNLISVAVNNTLSDITVPQGGLTEFTTEDGVQIVPEYTFDYFNYAGIHRPVILYTTPATYIDDITVLTDIEGDTGIISYQISIGGNPGSGVVYVSLLDKDENYVEQNVEGLEGQFVIPQANFWWPYLMDPNPGYLYTLEVMTENPKDVYRLPVGIRKLEWNNTSVTINGRPIYIRGFGKHEDSSIRGKGYDLPLITHDYNLIKWMGANAYRTSHYPYSEETMDFADKEGIMIIDECPGINIGDHGFSSELLEAHRVSLSRLYLRDKNRPSVIMWSIANEAVTNSKEAETHFSAVSEHIKALDKTRPIINVYRETPENDMTAQFVDVIGFNRYNGWYYGHFETIGMDVKAEAESWHSRFNKPVIMTEYGADAMPGLHLITDDMWSEEFQVSLLSKNFQAFDELRKKEYFIGEMIWNFADFNTAQLMYRVDGNKKGLFTRDRHPKTAAHHTRKRYWALAQELDNATLPDDLNEYISIELVKQVKQEL